MKLFTSQQLHELDEATCKAQNINSIDLMERAASALCCEFISRFLPTKRIVIIAGPGNNGGHALALAGMLYEQGYHRLEVYLFNVKGKLSYDCDEQRKRLITIDGVDFHEITREFNPPHLSHNDIVIDGLFGSGLKERLSGGFMAVARYINESKAYVVSIDVPSGLFGEWNHMISHRDMVHANLTLTFQTPRLSFFFPENEEVIGEWKLIDIDIDETAIKEMRTEYMLVESRTIRPLLNKRNPFTGKRDYGSVLLFTGSTGMMGAGVMAATATMRAGAGLATVHGPKLGLQIVQTAVPQAMYEPDRNDHFITDMRIHHNHQAVAIGPGIGVREETIDALEALLKVYKKPIILDADALNCIAKRPTMLNLLTPKTIITPHAGEFDRLFGQHSTSEERLIKAIETAKYYDIIIVLKGHFTAIIRPTGRVYLNPTGNPGMATAGSGDVLTGIIAAFLAQGYSPEHAATFGVYVHGLAGDLAAGDLGEFGLTALDIADYAGRAIRHIMNREHKINTF